jgi:hypothetical protein
MMRDVSLCAATFPDMPKCRRGCTGQRDFKKIAEDL